MRCSSTFIAINHLHEVQYSCPWNRHLCAMMSSSVVLRSSIHQGFVLALRTLKSCGLPSFAPRGLVSLAAARIIRQCRRNEVVLSTTTTTATDSTSVPVRISPLMVPPNTAAATAIATATLDTDTRSIAITLSNNHVAATAAAAAAMLSKASCPGRRCTLDS